MTRGMDVTATDPAPPPETPDLHGAFPRLGAEQLGALAARGRKRPTWAGEVQLDHADPALPRSASRRRCSEHSLSAGVDEGKKRGFLRPIRPLSAYECDAHHWPVYVSPLGMICTTGRILLVGEDPGKGTPFRQSWATRVQPVRPCAPLPAKMTRRRWDSNPPPCWSGDRGHGQEEAAACDFFVPVVTAPARSYPQVPDPVRTERGPVATLTDDTRAAGRLVLASGKEDSASQGHRRGRRPCSAGPDERSPGFGARVVGLTSTISMISTRPAGIGPFAGSRSSALCSDHD
jgi:hypothetical protein